MGCECAECKTAGELTELLTLPGAAGPTIKQQRSTTSKEERRYTWYLRSVVACEDTGDEGEESGYESEYDYLAADWADGPRLVWLR